MRCLFRKSLVLPVFIVCLVSTFHASAFATQEMFGASSESGGGSESYLGVDIRDITPDQVGPLRLKEERGVEVTMVDQDAPAGKAGLKEHDVILSINGSEIESVEQMRRMIHEIPSGRLITIGLSRNGEPVTLKVQLAARKAGPMAWAGNNNFKFNVPVMPVMPAMPVMPEIDMPAYVVVVHTSARSGLMVENLTPQLGDFFGVKDGGGILVRSVEKGSRGEKAGFHAGDIIIRINGQNIADSSDFSHALTSGSKSSASVTVLRDKKEITLTLTLPEHSPAGRIFNESLSAPVNTRAGVQLVRVQSEIACLQSRLEAAIRAHSANVHDLRRNLELREAELQQLAAEAQISTFKACAQINRELQRRQNQLPLEIRMRLQYRLQCDADI